MDADLLYYRLRNCLLTILDMEEALEKVCLRHMLHEEFSMIKNIMQHLEKLCVEEGDVRRIETATAHFLDELRKTLGDAGVPDLPRNNLWQ